MQVYHITNTAEFKAALSSAVAGDTILVAPGTYVDDRPMDQNAFCPRNDGQFEKPIIIKSEIPQAAVLSFWQHWKPSLGFDMGYQGRIIEYITVEDFTVEGGILVRTCENIILKNLKLSGGWIIENDEDRLFGINIENSKFCSAIECDISNFTKYGSSKPGIGVVISGISMTTKFNNVIACNVVGNENTFAAYGQRGQRVRNNYFINNKITNINVEFYDEASSLIILKNITLPKNEKNKE